MPLSTTELESKLWGAADILRGQIDSSDYKNYIFSMLFLKRLSDRFAEEVERAVADGLTRNVAERDPDEHEFFVPPEARWAEIVRESMNLGEVVNRASAEIEEANPGPARRRAAQHQLERRVEAGQPAQPRPHHRQPAAALRRTRPERREPDAGWRTGRGERPRRRLRVPDQPVRRRRRQEGRRVLHTSLGRAADRRAARAGRGDAHLRPDRGVGRDADLRRAVRRRAGWRRAQPRAARAGAQPRHARHWQAEPAATWAALGPLRGRRRDRGAAAAGRARSAATPTTG